MKDATFTLRGYNFPIVHLDLSKLGKENNFTLGIEPSGVYSTSRNAFDLTFRFHAHLNQAEDACIEVVCKAMFAFQEALAIDEIPTYFYANSIAILFPYLRAFISTLTLQANYQPIILPTKNLSDLADDLRLHTTVED